MRASCHADVSPLLPRARTDRRPARALSHIATTYWRRPPRTRSRLGSLAARDPQHRCRVRAAVHLTAESRGPLPPAPPPRPPVRPEALEGCVAKPLRLCPIAPIAASDG